MKNYSVVYLTEAEAELVSLWESTTDRTQVANAANTADQILATTPQSQSVYLGEELWRLEISPLRFYFAIREKDRVIEMSNVVRVAD